MGGVSSAERRNSGGASGITAVSQSGAGRPGGSPQIRCYHCQGIFTSALAGHTHHVRCPYCSTINGVPAQGAGATRGGTLTAAMNGQHRELSPMAAQRQEQLLRRLQAREITPLELLILREFVEHLQQNRSGASTHEIDWSTAVWTVDDVTKLPEELRTCCVCLEEVCVQQKVRTLPCLHTFHAECAEEWLKKKKVCPLCQFSICGMEDMQNEVGSPGH